MPDCQTLQNEAREGIEGWTRADLNSLHGSTLWGCWGGEKVNMRCWGTKGVTRYRHDMSYNVLEQLDNS